MMIRARFLAFLLLPLLNGVPGGVRAPASAVACAQSAEWLGAAPGGDATPLPPEPGRLALPERTLRTATDVASGPLRATWGGDGRIPQQLASAATRAAQAERNAREHDTALRRGRTGAPVSYGNPPPGAVP
jgi:hypothetical protein